MTRFRARSPAIAGPPREHSTSKTRIETARRLMGASRSWLSAGATLGRDCGVRGDAIRTFLGHPPHLARPDFTIGAGMSRPCHPIRDATCFSEYRHERGLVNYGPRTLETGYARERETISRDRPVSPAIRG